MKREILLKVVCVFEIVCGLTGLAQVLGVLLGWVPVGLLPVILYGLFPLVSLIAGILLWFQWKHAINLSLIVLLLQIPVIRTDDFLLHLGEPMSLIISGTWLSQHGGGPTILGINFLAVAAFMVLQWYSATTPRAPRIIERNTDAEPQHEVSPDA